MTYVWNTGDRKIHLTAHDAESRQFRENVAPELTPYTMSTMGQRLHTPSHTLLLSYSCRATVTSCEHRLAPRQGSSAHPYILHQKKLIEIPAHGHSQEPPKPAETPLCEQKAQCCLRKSKPHSPKPQACCICNHLCSWFYRVLPAICTGPVYPILSLYPPIDSSVYDPSR